MKKVGSLSGGEKSRLKLCLMMQRKVNFLLLDEPTNHLDTSSREWIESALDEFEGTMLFVSHDRYFLKKFADKVWSMENGTITQYNYGFEEYLETFHKELATEKVPSKKPEHQSSNVKNKTKLSSKSPKPIAIETLINETESELNKVNSEIEEDLLKGDFSKMNELYDKKNQLTKRIDVLYNEWLEEDF